ncbi:hypothetical protein JAAARDRAFT_60941 [Jaapia argillacea MUCL 33604]|uniref:UBR-type domain-containing protein n=1 Tax=Jaapia argillacea MUCL 33604 TaxID=933084 RepID=A0A067PJ12_9AGAM|nr:hypothetical protein JAAARDRAFT_60941 [Jaapia argillacea MUCL 33604]
MTSGDQTDTFTNILASHQDLIQDAAEALPHSFSSCTYSLGPLRQAVYLCLTCEVPRGICSACSIACHTDHEQVELFPKRNFRCDCPTSAIPHQCTLHGDGAVEEENKGNGYGQNFRGLFCRCGRKYDAKTERETMVQCVACEDWFHESCLNLRERPSSREPTPIPTANEQVDDDEARSEASSSGLPPPLLSASDYESLICGACVSNIPILKRWAGTQGVMMVIRDDEKSPWKILGSTEGDNVVDVVDESPITTGQVGSKRPHLESVDEHEERETKRPRGSPSSPSSPSRCLAPPPNPISQKILSTGAPDLGVGDIFLTEGWRERWCQCTSCLPSLQAHPWLVEEEETYEPPEDPDSGLTLEELGLRALQRLPRDRALDGIRAFNEMRDDLMKYLRPFAQEGKVVREEDVKAFFEERNAGS